MFEYTRMRLMQAREFVATKGLSQYFRERVYVQRKAIAVRKDLAEARFTADLFERGDVRFIEVTPENSFERHGGYVDESRKLKALYYLEQGYRGYALVRGGNIIGDIWYYAPDQAGCARVHPDLYWLGIELGPGQVYEFDIYFTPDERGTGLSAGLQNSAGYSQCQKGYSTAFAYYWADNVPAIWNTRVINKYKEWKHMKVSRCFLYPGSLRLLLRQLNL